MNIISSRPRSSRLSRPGSRRRVTGIGGATLVSLSIWILLTACTAAPAPEPRTAATTVGTAGANDAGEPAPAVDPEAPDATKEPEDREWLYDEKGRRYVTEERRKIEGYYTYLADGRVLLPPGVPYEVVEEREDVFIVKIFEVERRPERSSEDPEARHAAVEEPAVPEAEAVDRLRFTPFGNGLPSRGQWRHGFELVDIDGDGHLDIVHGPPRKGGGTPRIFLGNGEGSWRLWEEVTFEGPSLDYGDVAVADFDGDGHLDIAFAVHVRGIIVFRGDGAGRFAAWERDGLDYRVPRPGAEPPTFTSRAVAAVDWNRDGRMDLVAVGEGPTFARPRGEAEDARGLIGAGQGPVLLINGPREWRRVPFGPDSPFGDDLALGDVDGDGRVDLVQSSGVRGNRRIVHLARDDHGYETLSIEPLVRGAIFAVATADIDGDGREEILAGYTAPEEGEWRTGLDAYHLDAEGSWKRQPIHVEEGTKAGIWAIDSGDLDGDGLVDVVALTGLGDRWVFLGTEEGALERERSPELVGPTAGCRGFEARLADLDGDGTDEVVLAFAGEEGSEMLFPGAERRCTSGGGLEAWQASALATASTGG